MYDFKYEERYILVYNKNYKFLLKIIINFAILLN